MKTEEWWEWGAVRREAMKDGSERRSGSTPVHTLLIVLMMLFESSQSDCPTPKLRRWRRELNILVAAFFLQETSITVSFEQWQYRVASVWKNFISRFIKFVRSELESSKRSWWVEVFLYQQCQSYKPFSPCVPVRLQVSRAQELEFSSLQVPRFASFQSSL